MSVRNQQWPWFAIEVRTSCERTANLLLENAGYECFLPFARGISHRAERNKGFEMPLFPGHFFCRMNPHDRLPVLMTPGVVQIVGTGQTPMPVEETEIEALRRAEKSGLATMPWPYLQVGHAARMESGPLRGLTGILVKIKFGMKLVLSVNVLQRSAAVEIERSWIGAELPARPVAGHAQIPGGASPGLGRIETMTDLR